MRSYPAVPSTAKKDKLVVGSSTAAQVFAYVVNGTTYSYTAGAAETVATIGAALAAQIEASAVVSAA